MAAERPTAIRVARALIDLALAGVCLYVTLLVVSSAMDRANRNAELGIVVNEARKLYEAFERYHERNHAYPSTYTEASFDRATLDPLRKRGYYRGSIVGNLLHRQVDAYDSPDDRGPNREFWLEMTLRSDPTVRVLLASSDDAPLGAGQWREGVFLFQDGVLRPL